MALVMKLRSRCKKGCECENGSVSHGNIDRKSNKPADTKLIQTTSGNWIVSNVSTNHPVLKDSKDNKNIARKSAKSKMNSHNQKNTTKENQNCKTVSRKGSKRGCSEHSKADTGAVKVQRLSSSKSNKELTKSTRQMHQAQGTGDEPKKDVFETSVSTETVTKDTIALVRERTRKNPRRKCVGENKGAVPNRGSKMSRRKETSSVCESDQKVVCDAVDSDSQGPSTSALSSSVDDLKMETQKINSKTKVVEEQIAELEEELSKENKQIAKLKNLLAKSQVVKSEVEKKKEQVRQTESRRLTRRLDKKESEMERRATQLEKRLQTEVKSNQKEMQKFKKDLNSDWQKKMNKMQSAIRRIRHEMRTKVMSWRKQKETLELAMEQDLEGQKKASSRHKYFKMCKRQLKQMQADLEKQKLQVEKEGGTDTEKASQLKKLDAELSELKMLMNLLSLSPKEHMKVMAKKKEKEKLSSLIEEDLQCLICSEILIQATVLNCSHTFCQHCIIRWTKRKDHCPVCRTVITSKYSLENLDRYIDKVVDKFDDAFKEKRKKAITDRTEQENHLRQQVASGYFDDHSDSDSSDDDFWDVWDDDDDNDNLSIDFGDDDGEGSWDDWDDDLLSDTNDVVSSDSMSSLSSDSDGGFDDDGDSDTDSYDCVLM